MEHYVLHCFRGDPDRIPQLDLVMELDGKIVSQALCVRGRSSVTTGGGPRF